MGEREELMCSGNTEFGKEKQELLSGTHTAISTKAKEMLIRLMQQA